MANVHDIALFFIDMAQKQAQHECGDLMTNLRLQKLLYFAQGWHMARYGKPLFPDDIKAWTYGPVVPSEYERYKELGSGGIADVGTFSPNALTRDEYAVLLDVAREYDCFSTSSLINLTHRTNSPWQKAKRGNVIPPSDIGAYFSKERPLESFSDIVSQCSEVVTPSRDADGIAVFPADMANGWDAYDGN